MMFIMFALLWMGFAVHYMAMLVGWFPLPIDYSRGEVMAAELLLIILALKFFDMGVAARSER